MNLKDKLSDEELKKDYKDMFTLGFVEGVKQGKKEAVERMKDIILNYQAQYPNRTFHASEDSVYEYMERKEEMLEPLSTEQRNNEVPKTKV